jgi:hypothetical protein
MLAPSPGVWRRGLGAPPVIGCARQLLIAAFGVFVRCLLLFAASAF